MAITPLAALDRTASTFRADVDTFFGSGLPNFVTESNAQAAEIIAAGLLSGGAIAAAAAAQEAAADALVAAAAVGVAVDWANNIFATGTRMPFAQSAAPTGWTQDISDNANNRMLRVVNAVNGTPFPGVVTAGGSNSPILNDIVPSHQHSYTTGAESADHAHAMNHVHAVSVPFASGGRHLNSDIGAGYSNDNGSSSIGVDAFSGNTAGRNASHTHSGTVNANAGAASWTPRYIDMIICVKN